MQILKGLGKGTLGRVQTKACRSAYEEVMYLRSEITKYRLSFTEVRDGILADLSMDGEKVNWALDHIDNLEIPGKGEE